MDKMEQFKAFVNKRPQLKKLVDEKKYSWQELYERYDLYGEEDDLFKEEKIEEEVIDKKENTKESNSETSGISQFFDVIGSIDIDKVADGLNSMKKILSVISEVTSADNSSQFAKRNKSRPYTRDDD